MLEIVSTNPNQPYVFSNSKRKSLMLQQNHGLRTTALPPDCASDNDTSDVPTFMHSSRMASPAFDAVSGRTGQGHRQSKPSNLTSPIGAHRKEENHRRNFMVTQRSMQDPIKMTSP